MELEKKVTIDNLLLKTDLSEREEVFLNTHREILNAGAVIGNGLVNLGLNLKKMKEEKLYLEVGYKTFEDYSERACNLKRRQAYKYIQIVDNLDINFVHSSAQIGITKLALLSSLSEEERTEIIETTSLEDISVGELQEKIKELQGLTDSKDKELIKLQANLKDVQNKHAQEKLDYDNKINALNNQLKKKSEEQIVITKDTEETLNKIKNLNKEIKEIKEDNLRLKDLNISLSKEKEILNSSSLAEFKMYFDNLQELLRKITDSLSRIPEEKISGCKQALKKVVENYVKE